MVPDDLARESLNLVALHIVALHIAALQPCSLAASQPCSLCDVDVAVCGGAARAPHGGGPHGFRRTAVNTVSLGRTAAPMETDPKQTIFPKKQHLDTSLSIE